MLPPASNLLSTKVLTPLTFLWKKIHLCSFGICYEKTQTVQFSALHLVLRCDRKQQFLSANARRPWPPIQPSSVGVFSPLLQWPHTCISFVWSCTLWWLLSNKRSPYHAEIKRIMECFSLLVLGTQYFCVCIIKKSFWDYYMRSYLAL